MNDTKNKVTFVVPSILTGQVRPGYWFHRSLESYIEPDPPRYEFGRAVVNLARWTGKALVVLGYIIFKVVVVLLNLALLLLVRPAVRGVAIVASPCTPSRYTLTGD